MMRNGVLAMACVCALTGVGPARAAAPVSSEAQLRADEGLAAYKAKRYREAAAKFEAARAHIDDANLLWNAGRAWERAGELERARERYVALLARADVDGETRVSARAALERMLGLLAARASAMPGAERIAVYTREREVAAADGNRELVEVLDRMIESERGRTPVAVEPLEAPPDKLVPWAVLIGGLAITGAGIGLAVVGQSQLDALDDDQARAAGGPITTITRADALERRDEGDTLRLVGGISAGVGAAAAITGLVLLLGDDSPGVEGRTTIGLMPRRDGWEVAWTGQF